MIGDNTLYNFYLTELIQLLEDELKYKRMKY